jgi:hypothetical protein
MLTRFLLLFSCALAFQASPILPNIQWLDYPYADVRTLGVYKATPEAFGYRIDAGSANGLVFDAYRHFQLLDTETLAVAFASSDPGAGLAYGYILDPVTHSRSTLDTYAPGTYTLAAYYQAPGPVNTFITGYVEATLSAQISTPEPRWVGFLLFIPACILYERVSALASRRAVRVPERR